jgi:hypothetical protein
VQCSSVIAVCRNETTGNFVDIHERFGGISWITLGNNSATNTA